MVASCQAARKRFQIEKEINDHQKEVEHLKQQQEKEEEARRCREIAAELGTREKLIKEKEKAAEDLLKSYQYAICSIRAEREKLAQDQVEIAVTSQSAKRRRID